MTKKPVISFWGVPLFAGILGSLPIGAMAAEFNIYAPVVLPRLGIAEQMGGKTALTAVGEDAVRRVANGESEIVIVQ